jgi:poly(glycerol-phosphate) alpha-glucosyltransferase
MTTHCNLPQGFAVGAAVCIDTTAPSIAHGLLDILTMTDEERSAMGICGRQLVEQQFSWASYAEHMDSVYAWMSRSEARPGCVSLV